jgi:branched-chain amino acid transport system permease protein
MSFTTIRKPSSAEFERAVYGLVSIGLSMIFGVVKTSISPTGEFLMVGMYVSYALWALWESILDGSPGDDRPFFLGRASSFFIRRVLNAPDLAQIFLTVGLSVLMMNLASISSGRIFVPLKFLTRTGPSLWPSHHQRSRLIACLGAIVSSLLLALSCSRPMWEKR